MRYIIALLIIACAVPAYATGPWHVNAGDSRARNLPAAQGYGTTDSPWITPSYAIANASNADTIFIYGYNVGTDTSNYYQDAIFQAGKSSVHIVGVSVGDDSPTFSGPARIAATNATGNCTGSIDGIRFISTTTTNNLVYLDGVNADVSISNCVFWSNPNSPSGIVNVYSRAASKQDTLTVYNCAFVNSPTSDAVAMQQTNSANTVGLHMQNCTINNLRAAIYTGGGVTTPGDYNTIKDSILTCSYIMRAQNMQTFTTPAKFNFVNSDTLPAQSISIAAGSADFTMTVIAPIDTPVMYAHSFTTETGAFGYITAANTSLFTASSTGGLIGVLWGYASASPPAAAAGRRRPTMVETFRLLLWGR